MSKKETIKVFDLFAGVGGFSEGFILNKCDLVAHVEMDKDACSTIETRIIYHALRKRGKMNIYIDYASGKITKEEIVQKYDLHKEMDSVINVEITNKNCNDIIQNVRNKLNGNDLDIIIGGPPCQAYSYIGRSRDKNRMQGDKRNYLYKLYIKFLMAFKPKIFLFENVPGLKTAGGGEYLAHMRKMMKLAGYNTNLKELNASDYGTPQNRKRIILIGWNSKSGLEKYPDFKKIKREYKVGDFLSGLPKLKAGQERKIGRYMEKNKILYKLGITSKNFSILTSHIARPHNKRDLEIYKIATRRNNNNNLRYNELPDKLKTHKNQKDFIDRFKVIDFESNACQTILAHIY